MNSLGRIAQTLMQMRISWAMALLLAAGCTTSAPDAQRPSQAQSVVAPVSGSTASVATPASPPAQLNSPPGSTSTESPPAATGGGAPFEIPQYPDGVITRSETGQDGTLVLMTTRSSWDTLKQFYATALVSRGWTPVASGASGQMQARFEKDEHVLTIEMQPGRQEQNLARILLR
jgi:hypothetical protein